MDNLQNDKDKEGKKIVPPIKNVIENSTDSTVEFTIQFNTGVLAELEAKCDSKWHGCNGLEKMLGLFTTKTTTNMWLFDRNNKLKYYTNANEIIDDHYWVRLEMYEKRKEYLIRDLEEKTRELSNKARYLREVLEGTIDLRRKKNQEIVEMLEGKLYERDDKGSFEYLIKMRMDCVSEENAEKIMNEYEDKMAELALIRETTVAQMWMKELDDLLGRYTMYEIERDQMLNVRINEKSKENGKEKKERKKYTRKITVEN